MAAGTLKFAWKKKKVPKQYYDIKTLQDYLAGRLDAKTMHALERQMLDDPLLQEALEGLARHPEISAEALDAGMDRLSDRLADRTISSGSAQTGTALSDLQPKEEKLATVRKLSSSRRKWLGAAAVVLVLLAGGWLYFVLQGNDRSADPHHTQTSNEIASAIDGVLTDSNAEKHKISGSNAQKTNKTDTATSIAAAGNKTDKQGETPAAQLAMGEKPAAVRRPEKEMRSRSRAAPQAEAAARSSVKVDTATVLSDVLIAKADSPVKNHMNDIAAGHIPGLIRYGAQSPNSITGAARMRSIRIRGLRPVMDSLYPDIDTQPLFVINGTAVAAGHLDSLNPADISHIEIAKDQTASAIYGSRAANGVIFITTKNVNAAHVDTGAAYAKGVNLLKAKAAALKEAGPASQLQEGTAGVSVATQKAPLLVHVKRISGHLQPQGGLGGLQNYLQQRLADDIWKGNVGIADTGRATFEVRMEQKDNGHGSVITITDKKATNKGTQRWVSGWLKKRLQWETDPGYDGAPAGQTAIIEIELSKK